MSAQGAARLGHGRLVPGAAARVVAGQLVVARPEGVAAVACAQGHVGVVRVAVGQAGEQVEHLAVQLAGRVLRGVGADVLLEAAVDGLQLRVGGQVLDVLGDAVEEQLHGVLHLADFPAAAVDEAFPRLAAQVEDHQHGDQQHRQAGNGGEGQDQFLFEVHP